MTQPPATTAAPGRPRDCGPVRALYYDALEAHPTDSRIRFPFGPCIDMPFGLPPFPLGSDVIEPPVWLATDTQLAEELSMLGVTWTLLEEKLEAVFRRECGLGFALPSELARLRHPNGPRGPVLPNADDTRPVTWVVFPNRQAVRGHFYTLPALPDSWILSDRNGNRRPNALRIWYWLLPDVRIRTGPSKEKEMLDVRKRFGDVGVNERPTYRTRLEELQISIKIAGQALANQDAGALLGIRDDEQRQQLLANWAWAQQFYGKVPGGKIEREKLAASMRKVRQDNLDRCTDSERRAKLAEILEPARIEHDVNQALGDPKAASSVRDLFLGTHAALRGSRTQKTGFVKPIVRAAHRALWQAIPEGLPLDDLPAGLRRMAEMKATCGPEESSEPATFNVAGEWDDLLSRVLNHMQVLFGVRTYHQLDADAVRQARRPEQTST